MSDIPAPPPGFELDAPGVTKQPAAASAGVAPPPPPPGFEIDKAPEETFQRGTILPFEKGSRGTLRPAVPQLGKDLIDTITLPKRAAKGEDVTMDDLINAAGFITPGVAPVRGKTVLDAADKAIPKPVARALKSDGLKPEDVAPKLAELGPDGVLADLGPNLQAQAGAVATTPGAGQKTVVNTLTARKAGAPDRLRTELDTTLGPAPVPSEVKAALTAGQKALSPEYKAALATASPVDTTKLAASLDETIPTLRGPAQEAIAGVRKMLNKTGGEAVTDPATIISAELDPTKRRELVRKHLAGEPLVTPMPLDTDPGTLLATRHAIGGMLDSTADGNVRNVLTQAKKDIDALLTASVPGIKEIDAKHGSLAEAKTNIDVGQAALDSGRDAPRPVELRAQMDKANQPIGTEMGPTVQARALTQGARAEIDRIVGTNLNDRAALNNLVKGEGDWNYDRLSTLFGKEKTDRIYKVLENERTMAQTENMATTGSKTGAITAAQKEVEMSPAGPGVLQSAGDLKAGTALARIKDRVMSGVAEKRQSNLNDNIADVIMGRGPLKADTVGQSAMLPAMIEAIMRPQVNPNPNAVDRERLKRMQNDRVY